VSADGKAEVYFDPADKYIWSLAVLGDGSLAVGTGGQWEVVPGARGGAKPENSLLINTNQTHVMSLVVTKQGDLIAGQIRGDWCCAFLQTAKHSLSMTAAKGNFMRSPQHPMVRFMRWPE